MRGGQEYCYLFPYSTCGWYSWSTGKGMREQYNIRRRSRGKRKWQMLSVVCYHMRIVGWQLKRKSSKPLKVLDYFQKDHINLCCCIYIIKKSIILLSMHLSIKLCLQSGALYCATVSWSICSYCSLSLLTKWDNPFQIEISAFHRYACCA